MTEKPICVLLDTNAWRTNLLLRTAMGSALLYTVNRASHKLALPAVIEDEITKHSESAGHEAKAKIQRSFRDLQAILGRHSPFQLPSEEEIRIAIEERFAKLNGLIVRVPFTIAHAKAALRRVNQSIPPSSTRRQQFKDSCVWEAAMELASKYDIMLVSNDGDFYQDKNKNQLNTVLQKEVDESGRSICVYATVDRCLEELQRDRPTLGLRHIAETIVSNIREELTQSASKHNLRPAEIEDKVKPFITEDHDRPAVEYAITLDAVNTDVSALNSSTKASVTVEGTCVYDARKQAVDDNRFHTIGASWVDTEGEPPEASIYKVQGATSGGNRMSRTKQR